MSENLDKKFLMYMSTFYMLTMSSHRKLLFLHHVQKRQNLVLKNAFHETFVWPFYTCHKICRFPMKLSMHTQNIKRQASSFCSGFLAFQNIFSSSKSIYSNIQIKFSVQIILHLTFKVATMFYCDTIVPGVYLHACDS